VLRHLAAAGASQDRLDACTLAAARAAANASAWEDARTLLAPLLDRADPPTPAAAAGALVVLERADFAEATRLADAVIADATATPPDRCQALEVLGRLARRTDLDRAEQHFTAAVATAELADLDLWAARAAHELATIAQLRHLDVTQLQAAHERAERAGAPGLVATIDFHLAALHGVRFEPEPGLDAGRRVLDVARRLGATRQEAWAWNLIGQAHAAGGERERARAAAGEALQLAGDDHEIAAIAIGTAKGPASLLADDRDRGLDEYRQAIGHLRQLPAHAPLPPWYLWPLLATVYDLEGDGGQRARREADDPALRVTTGVDGLWHVADAVAHGRAGDTAAANAASELADARFAAVPAFAGYVHLARRFAAGAALTDGWGRPAEWLTASQAWASDHGHDGLRSACAALGRKAGVPQRRRRRGAADVPARLGALGVTSREVDVLQLVAEGLTNAEIAERLYLSPRTIKGYVENLLAKTGAANRTQLSAHAAPDA
jgi:DNA-binding CsgD family transcriptional regulator/tetratricopeptide (TPR) repeat protein